MFVGESLEDHDGDMNDSCFLWFAAEPEHGKH